MLVRVIIVSRIWKSKGSGAGNTVPFHSKLLFIIIIIVMLVLVIMVSRILESKSSGVGRPLP